MGIGIGVAIPDEIILNSQKKYAPSNLVNNGDFMDGSNGWILGTGWTIPGGYADCDGTQSSNTALRSSTFSPKVGATYEVTFTLLNRSAGAITPIFGSVAGTSRNSDGTYTEQVVAGGTVFSLRGNSSFVGQVKDVIVRRIA